MPSTYQINSHQINLPCECGSSFYFIGKDNIIHKCMVQSFNIKESGICVLIYDCVSQLRQEVSLSYFEEHAFFDAQSVIDKFGILPEKQFPKPIKDFDEDKYKISFVCPTCGMTHVNEFLGPSYRIPYCFSCGQALDWNNIKNE